MSITRMLNARGLDKSLYRVIDEPNLLSLIAERTRVVFQELGTARMVPVGNLTSLSTEVGNLPLGPEGYYVCWASTGCIHTSGTTIAHRIDDLWYPSSDDVAVMDENLRVLFVIHHEEFLYLFP